MNRVMRVLAVVFVAVALAACEGSPTSSDIVRDKQETMVQEGVAKVGMPGIKNFRMLKLKRLIEEMQDQEGLVTYTYVENLIPTIVKGHTVRGGKFTFFCDSFGYPMPYATQFSAPETMQRWYLPSRGEGGGNDIRHWGVARLPQSEPNGLHMPASAEGTWVVCKDPDPKSEKNGVVYSEPKLVAFPFKLKLDD